MARRCGHCYQSGHNRRSCPQIRKEIRDNPDGYQARIERQKKEHAKRNPRRCSYCHESGHNKKTCSKLEIDRVKMAHESRQWRVSFLTRAEELGFTVGTLLKFSGHLEDSKCSDYGRERAQQMVEKHGLYAMVTKLLPRELDRRQQKRSYGSVKVRFANGSNMKVQLPSEFGDMMDRFCDPMMSIASPVDASGIKRLFNYEWHDGTDTALEHIGQGRR